MSLFSIDTAIVNGDIKEPKESSIASQEAINMGVCIHTSEESSYNWQLIDYDLELEGKPQSAVTIWRTLKQWSGVKDALNETVSLVELKPKTGRHHQESPRNVNSCAQDASFDLSLPVFDYPCKSYVLISVTISSLLSSKNRYNAHLQLRRHMVSDYCSCVVSFNPKHSRLSTILTSIIGMGSKMSSPWRQKIRRWGACEHEIPGRWILSL